MADARGEQAAVPDAALPHSLHDDRQQRYDPLQEKVKEQDGGSTAEEPIKDKEHLSCNCHWRCHPKTCRSRAEIVQLITYKTWWFSSHISHTSDVLVQMIPLLMRVV